MRNDIPYKQKCTSVVRDKRKINNMSVREVQTAAARVIHVDRISDSALQELKSRFHYHPLDLEALFSAAVEPKFSAYGEYSFVTLLWPDALTQDISELRFFIDARHLTIIGDTPQQDVAHFVSALHDKLAAPESQLSAPELVHAILALLRQSWQSGSAQLNAIAQRRLIGNAQVIRQLGRWLQSKNMIAVVPQLVIDAHALDSLAEHRQQQIEKPMIQPKQKLPSLLRGYAVASAVMVIVVIATLAVQ